MFSGFWERWLEHDTTKAIHHCHMYSVQLCSQSTDVSIQPRAREVHGLLSKKYIIVSLFVLLDKPAQ